MNEATKIVYENNDWITVIVIIILCLFIALKFLYNDRLFYSGTFFLSKKHLQINFSPEKNIFSITYHWIFFTIQLLVLGFLGLFLNEKLNFLPSRNTIINYFTLLLITSSYFLIRYLAGLLLAYLFNLKHLFRKLSFDKTSYFNNLTLWILPFILLAIYSPSYNLVLKQLSIIIFFILLIIRYILFLINNKKLVFSDLFYFILYLCALEIAPFILISKLTI